MGDSARLRLVKNGLGTVTQPVGQPGGLNAVPTQLVQKTAMLNAVKGFRGVSRDKRSNGASVEVFSGKSDSVEQGRLRGQAGGGSHTVGDTEHGGWTGKT